MYNHHFIYKIIDTIHKQGTAENDNEMDCIHIIKYIEYCKTELKKKKVVMIINCCACMRACKKNTQKLVYYWKIEGWKVYFL